MPPLLARWLGFALPTTGVVLFLHLRLDRGAGAWLDGLVSAAWFTLPFLAARWLRGRRSGTSAAPAQREFTTGLLAGSATWLALGLAWQAAAVGGLRPWAFLANSLAMALAGWLARPPAPARRPDPLEPAACT